MFGHKFSSRLGHVCEPGESNTSSNGTSSASASKETSPVFTQFLECVWQITQQFPCAFEFNERFLVKLHEHAHSCQFGNFVGNCEKDRLDYKYAEYVKLNRGVFTNQT